MSSLLVAFYIINNIFLTNLTDNGISSNFDTNINNSIELAMANNLSVKKETTSVKNTKNNTVTSMSFTDKGIKIKGKLKKVKGKYKIKLCSKNKCYSYSTKLNKNKFSSDINLLKLKNGTYDLYIENNGKKEKIVDLLDEESRIVRTRVGNKLVTVSYKNNNPKVKIENFKYVYDVIIDVGHGGSDGGSSNKYILEKDLNLMQSLYEKKRFEEHGLKVLITRDDDTYGLQMGSTELIPIRRRSYAVGYYGVVSKIVYSNHHNSIENKKYSGYELILSNTGTKNDYKTEYQIASEWNKTYQLRDKHIRVYGRDYDTDEILSKEKGQTYNIKNFYGMQRIPYELFNINTVTYEGCYLSNLEDYKWYMNNWQTLSEIKIKNYVESLGIKYKK